MVHAAATRSITQPRRTKNIAFVEQRAGDMVAKSSVGVEVSNVGTVLIHLMFLLKFPTRPSVVHKLGGFS